MLFITCAMLVQRLLLAKAQLKLEKELVKLDKMDALIIDDLGYVQQSREEMEVLFTLLAHRYEHRSILISSNLAFSRWEQIFKDPMATAVAIDRLVHHSVILELNLPSYRMETAKAAQKSEQPRWAAKVRRTGLVSAERSANASIELRMLGIGTPALRYRN